MSNVSKYHHSTIQLLVHFVLHIVVNDTVVGDPLYTVPLQVTDEIMAENPDFVGISLCYEIRGRANEIFKLVSDHCVSVTAEYIESVNNNNLNFINKIGVLAVDNGGDCQNITIDADGCVASVGRVAVSQAPYHINGISVRKLRNKFHIAVPNCELQDPIVWVICETKSSLKFVIMRGSNLQPTSHGLIGT